MSGSQTAVVVVNYGSHRLLSANLAPLTRQIPNLTVVIVDNYRSDAERTAVTELAAAHRWQLVAPSANLGYGEGNNRGVAAAKQGGASRFLLLNPDARIEAPALAELEAAVTADPMTLAAPVITTGDGRLWSDGSDLYLATGRMRATRKRNPDLREDVSPWLSGACLMVSAELWDRLNGFDDRYFLYWEDVDLSWRCLQAGGRLLVVREAAAIHDEGGTSQAGGERSRSSVYYYYNIRNRLLFAALHLSPRQRRAWRASSAAEAWDILLRGGRRQLLASVQPWRAALTGTLHGLALMRQVGRSRACATFSVLESFPAPRPTTNPYIVLLKECLDADERVDLTTFSWRAALTRRHDVFHAHWPEILVSGSTPAREVLRQVLFACFLVRLRLSRTAVVRTVHNVELPSGLSRRQIGLLALFDRLTTLSIRLNTSTDLGDRPHATIVHGHYREWFARYPAGQPVPGRLAYVGLIRRYKAVPTLLHAFAATRRQRPELSLFVGGRPSSDDLASELRDLSTEDPRVQLRLAFLTDAEFVAAVTAAELVVLPYQDMHNSGGVLAALSLDRPVLVPDNEVNRALAAEVGQRWVHRYPVPLRPEDLLHTLVALPSRNTDSDSLRPDLDQRDWSTTATRHLEVFRRASMIRAGERQES